MSPRRRRRSSKRGKGKLLTKRRSLLLLGISTFAGAVGTGAFTSATVDRLSNVGAATDANALIKVDELSEGTVYAEPHTVTVVNQTSNDLTGTNQVGSQNGDLQFRKPGTTDRNNPLQLADLSPGEQDTFEVVTATGENGKVSDTVTLEFAGPNFSTEIVRDTTVRFNAAGQLIYAVGNGDIRVYDAVNDILNDPPQTVGADAVGARASDIVGDSNADIPYISQSNNKKAYATGVGNASDTVIDKGNKPKLKYKKTRVALGTWPPSKFSDDIILVADNNAAKIIGIKATGETDTIASPPSGCGGVAGVNDIDNDGNDEMVFIDSSQQMRYLNQDGSTVKVQNGSVGSNNSAGFGSPADFDGDGTPEIPLVDGSNNPAIITYSGNKTILNSNGIAKKAAVAPVDLDGDGKQEFTFIDSSTGEIRYVDDVLGTNNVKTLIVNGSSVKPLEKVGLNTQG